jgi:hypothetical protein
MRVLYPEVNKDGKLNCSPFPIESTEQVGVAKEVVESGWISTELSAVLIQNFYSNNKVSNPMERDPS